MYINPINANLYVLSLKTEIIVVMTRFMKIYAVSIPGIDNKGIQGICSLKTFLKIHIDSMYKILIYDY